jgi:protein-S-isoprenylcysteine O-methyltransferase Ste14
MAIARQVPVRLRWNPPLVLRIPRTRREIWLNRIRVWLPAVFVLVGLALRRPTWDLWGLPLIGVGETVRTWAAGNLIKDESLTVGGPYAHVRNPLYLGSLLSGTGFLLILGDWRLAAAFAVISLAIYLPIVKQEEDYLGRMHGAAFAAYRTAVPALIPRPTPARVAVEGVRHSRFEWRWVFLNEEHRTWLALALVAGLMALRSRV